MPEAGSASQPPIHVLFLPAHPARTSATTTYRVLKYVPGLQALGIQSDVHEPLPAFAESLLPWEGQNLAQKAVYYAVFFLNRLWDVLRASHYDAVVIERDLCPLSTGFLEKLLLRINPATVYDTDDFMHLAPRVAAHSLVYRLRPWKKFTELMRDVSHIVVANQVQADYATRLNDRTTVIPMTLDYERYASAPRPERPAGHRAVLGWTGTSLGFHYIREIEAPLRAIASHRPIELHVISGAKSSIELNGVPVVRKPWREETEVSDLKYFDVGLIPLPDEPFERGKFPFKALQYMAAGVPVVASPVGMTASLIEHGKTGLLASTPDDWRQCTEQLLDDGNLRARVVKEAQRLVRQHYSNERWTPVWNSILREAAAQRE